MNKPNLKVTKEVFFEVDYREFEKFIEEVYGVYLDFVGWQECGNDSSTVLYASKKENLEPLTPETVIENRWDIMDDLCNKGLIEEGKYLVRVCW
jgi:hypothetical protein